MEIVVKIPDDMIKSLEQGNFGAKYNIYDLAGCLMNGTVLPEHGDLIDRNCICKAIYAAEDNLTGSGMTYDEMNIYNDGINAMWDKLQNAEPIIEANKGVLEKINKKQDSLKAVCKAWDEAIQKDGYVN